MFMRFVFSCALYVAIFAPVYATPARVDYIVDGDTFGAHVLLEDDIAVSVRVRLRNIDTPEIHGDCEYERERALMAKNRLAELIPVGSVVQLEKIKDDKYLGRIDAYVKMSDGRDVGAVLISEQMGRPYSGGRRAGWCN